MGEGERRGEEREKESSVRGSERVKEGEESTRNKAAASAREGRFPPLAPRDSPKVRSGRRPVSAALSPAPLSVFPENHCPDAVGGGPPRFPTQPLGPPVPPPCFSATPPRLLECSRAPLPSYCPIFSRHAFRPRPDVCPMSDVCDARSRVP
eukprot:scaffold235722_cov33-Tisochrysis_lutea.AAC.3